MARPRRRFSSLSLGKKLERWSGGGPSIARTKGRSTFTEAKLSNLTPGDAPELQKLQLALLAKKNRDHLLRTGPDPRLEGAG